MGGSMKGVTSTPASKAIKPTTAAPAAEPAKQPQAPAQASDRLMTLPQIPPFQPPAKYKHVEDYKAFVQASGVFKLPAYQKQLDAANAAFGDAQKTLNAHKDKLGYGTLQSNVANGQAAVDDALHPMKAEAAKTRAEAEGLKPKMDSLARDIARNNNGAALNTGAAGISTYGAYKSETAGDAAVNGLLAVANAAAAASERKKAAQLSAQLAEVQAEYGAKIQVAVQLEHTPGDPATIAAAKQHLTEAQDALKQADVELAGDSARAQQAQATRDSAQANVDHLQAAKTHLSNYSDCFTLTSRFSMPKGWKEDLDAFWKAQN